MKEIQATTHAALQEQGQQMQRIQTDIERVSCTQFGNGVSAVMRVN